MKREIVCNECKEKLRKLFPTDFPYPGEHIKFVKGKAKDNFNCDHCNCKINTKDTCNAISVWTDYSGLPYYEWEPDYLEISL